MQERKITTTFNLYESAKIWLAKKAKEDNRSSNYLLNQIIKEKMEQEQSQQESKQ